MRSYIPTLLCAGAALTTASPCPILRETAPTAEPQVHIKNGTINGLRVSSFEQEAFLGIPFAEPPTGPLRFSLPQPVQKAWNSSFNAHAYPPKCAGYGSEQIGDFEVSEDCLYLNVIRPDGYDCEKLPVAVWIHGGAFSQGGTVDSMYNLSYMIQNSIELNKPFIAVSLQYRLNAYGFVDGKEVKEAGVTNLGIRDQRQALQWVQENIAAFGGDAEKVTIFGESAGAASIGIHLTAYGGRDDKLFSAAIMESGAPFLLGSKYNAAVEQAKYDKLVSATGCSTAYNGTLNCLRSLSYSAINDALNGTAAGSFFPYADGDLISESLYDQLATGAFVKVPIIAGANSDEGIFTALGTNVNTDAEFRVRTAAYGSNATVPFLEVLYPDIPSAGIPEMWTVPPAGRGVQVKRWAALSGDYTFVAPRRLTCQSWSAHGVNAYCYRFNGRVANLPGSTHYVEVAYVFYNLARMAFPGGAAGVPEKYAQTAKLMSNMWVSFFTTQDPNGHGVQGAADWPRYDDGAGGYGEDFVFEVEKPSGAERDNWRAEGIAYLNSVFSAFGLAHPLERAPASLPSSHHHAPQTPLELPAAGHLQLLGSLTVLLELDQFVALVAVNNQQTVGTNSTLLCMPVKVLQLLKAKLIGSPAVTRDSNNLILGQVFLLVPASEVVARLKDNKGRNSLSFSIDALLRLARKELAITATSAKG
ncbi:hypothetical protein OPT61_g5427 [Boeremia exigua]|uniref:Uncharacterized protein n=1 Tax=Boeremia exigua TaxID=749465 RepID=A0ACC2IAI1_9PLEO|nr:hypothetical protein OPT61_g5427 [Boeremia exigua]